MIDVAIAHTLANGSQTTRAIVAQHIVANEAAAMPVGIEIIITKMHLVTVLTQSLHLIVYLLADAADLGETVIDKEKNLHFSTILVQK